MIPTQLTYPIFAANQVLASDHLNQLFDRLDEQNRLTRTNLIGIGIACGLEPEVIDVGSGNVRIRISSGVGVTSEGYLIVVNEDAEQIADDYEWFRPYQTPDNVAYREFEEATALGTRDFPLWELARDRDDDDQSVRLTRNFLRGVNQPAGRDEEKILVLFLECLEESNRNCSPNSCADKGNTVTASVKPLLVRKSDIDILQARIRGLGPEVESYFSLTDTMSSRLGMPTLKMPRYDVNATSLNGTTSVFSAFQTILSAPLVNRVAAALSGAYQAFSPLLRNHTSDPFASLDEAWAFLHDGSIEADDRYLHYQYFYDHLEIIIHAYEEFRAQGLEIMGLCGPDGRLFRRHLFLANVGQNPASYDYRHDFVPSPLFTRATGSTDELRSLFERLVLLVGELELPPQVGNLVGDVQTFDPGFRLPEVFTVRPDLLTAQPQLRPGVTATDLSDRVRDLGSVRESATDLSRRTRSSDFNVAGLMSSSRVMRETTAKSGTAASTALLAKTELPSSTRFIAANLNRNFAFFNNSFRTFFRPRLTTDIVITPSKLGGPLSNKAIPYHYRPSPLFQYWSYRLTRQGKARENLGYRHSAWNNVDAFVQNPLGFDQENHNFLRVEGHIGQNYSTVLSELLAQRRRYRLPIDIVALKTGGNADNVRLTKVADCNFQDLESLYGAFREELLCQLTETVKRFYNTQVIVRGQDGVQSSGLVPNLPLLRQQAPNFRYLPGTVGAHYDENLNLHNDNFPYRGNLDLAYYYHLFFILRITQLAEQLPTSLSQFDIDAFGNAYNEMTQFMELLNNFLLRETNEEGQPLLDNVLRGVDEDEFSDQLDLILYACKMESFQSIATEYASRLEKMRERLLLRNFANQHPGLQHKAGVTPGGTLVLVYHGEDQPDDIPVREGNFRIRGSVVVDGEPAIGATIIVRGTTTGTVTDIDGNFIISSTRLPVTLDANFTGFASRSLLVNRTEGVDFDLNAPQEENQLGRFGNLAVGTVLADFYLPYLCCSDCAPVQFVLPKEPPTFSWEQIGCTNPNNGGEITLFPSGGTPPYDYSLDGGVTWSPMSGENLEVNDGAQLNIRDADGTISVRRTVDLKPAFIVQRLDDGGSCNEEGTEYSVRFRAEGGQPPYQLLTEDTITNYGAGQEMTISFPSGEAGGVIIRDSSNPVCQQRFDIEAVTCETPNVCNLPAGGKTITASYPFWMQRNTTEFEYEEVRMTVRNFGIIDNESGVQIFFNSEQLEELTSRITPDTNLTTPSSFTQTWNDRLAKTNDYLREQLDAAFNSEEHPVLQFELDTNMLDKMSGLRATHYASHRFTFEFSLEFNSPNAKSSYRRDWSYSEAGCVLREQWRGSNNDVATSSGQIPAFNRVETDRCNPDLPAVSTCDGPFDVELSREELGIGFWQFGRETSSDLPVMWLVETGISAITSSEQPEIRLRPNQNYTILALVVDPDSGCAGLGEISANTTIIF